MSLPLASIFLEVFVCLIGLFGVFRAKKGFLGITIAYIIYTFYDLAAFYNWHSNLVEQGREALYFIAIAGTLFSIWEFYKN